MDSLLCDDQVSTRAGQVQYRTIARYLIRQAALTRTRAATGAVTLIQRYGSALNLNIHFHMLFKASRVLAFWFGAPGRAHLLGGESPPVS